MRDTDAKQAMMAATLMAGVLRPEPSEPRVLPTKRRPKRKRDPVAELRRRRREERLAKMRGEA
jgi:hypothetical protein